MCVSVCVFPHYSIYIEACIRVKSYTAATALCSCSALLRWRWREEVGGGGGGEVGGGGGGEVGGGGWRGLLLSVSPV